MNLQSSGKKTSAYQSSGKKTADRSLISFIGGGRDGDSLGPVGSRRENSSGGSNIWERTVRF